MNNKEFVSELSQRTGYTIKDTTTLLNAFVAELSERLENEETISVSDFGVFEVKKKMERVVVNPSTKQKMLVPPKIVLNFKASAALKDKLKDNE